MYCHTAIVPYLITWNALNVIYIEWSNYFIMEYCCIHKDMYVHYHNWVASQQVVSILHLFLKNICTFQQVFAEQGETSIILSFISAAGNVVPPMVIHKGAQVQDTWKLKAPGDIKIAATPKGYITKSCFHEYGLHFVKYLKKMGLMDKNIFLSMRPWGPTI